jgi:hypothetical protein
MLLLFHQVLGVGCYRFGSLLLVEALGIDDWFTSGVVYRYFGFPCRINAWILCLGKLPCFYSCVSTFCQ